MIKVICDRCGREIAGSSLIGYVMLNFRQGLEGILMSENPLEQGHYCPNCMGDILKFIAAEPMPEQAEPEPEEAEPEAEPEPDGTESDKPETGVKPEAKLKAKQKPVVKPKPRGTIDYGKIMALRNAGWSRDKIADEMGMTPNAVSNAVYTYNRRKERERDNK